ncbi:aluminum-activated malate transporter 1-like protein [Carex littledalei]|uniref:Aluminum-activated malate transporter 1-like protein n=1 Tax=Carex littledalei TaxID=544730 RepID=A0A833RG53_9POAL|nr:aluminum-activated malate transporter 1-like protein [Carex littledalei]
MDIEQGNDGKIALSEKWPRLSQFFAKVKSTIIGFLEKIKKIAMDDPRRIAHAMKVGLALTIISTLYYVTPLYDGFGESSMWAVLTVVVVMEYTAGGTLSKGLNRTFATVVAGSLGVGAHQIAALCGEKGEAILLALFVFLLAASATFSRFIPEVKARYDYGVTIFILTFSLVAVSSYRANELIQMAHQRISTIAIGVATCLCVSLFVFPVWAGEDLHKMVASNLDKLANFLEGMETECFGEKSNFESLEGKPFLQVHKSVLNSKTTEDSLCNFAKWEPCHGDFSFRHPWKQYQKVGGLIRQCAASMDALSSYLTTFSKTKPIFKADTELLLEIQTACSEMSSESAKALRELSSAIRSMTIPSLAKCHLLAATSAADNLRTALSNDITVWETIHVAMVASLLAELVNYTKEIASSVDELAELALFKSTDSVNSALVKPKIK